MFLALPWLFFHLRLHYFLLPAATACRVYGNGAFNTSPATLLLPAYAFDRALYDRVDTACHRYAFCRGFLTYTPTYLPRLPADVATPLHHHNLPYASTGGWTLWFRCVAVRYRICSLSY